MANNQAMTTFELWFHEHLGAFAVRIEEGQVTGTCPVRINIDRETVLANLDYDGREEAIGRFRDYPEQFCYLMHWWRGEWIVPAPAQPKERRSWGRRAAGWAGDAKRWIIRAALFQRTSEPPGW